MFKSVLAVLCLFALVGCVETPSGTSGLESAVEDAGYSVTGMFLGSDSFGTQYLELDVEVSDTSTFTEDAERIAKIVWTTFDGGFDQLEITFNRSMAMSYTHELLTEMFGERPPEPTKPSLLPMTIGIVVAALLITGWALFPWRRRKPSPQPSTSASPDGDVIGR